jgi:hypothetical protein
MNVVELKEMFAVGNVRHGRTQWLITQKRMLIISG